MSTEYTECQSSENIIVEWEKDTLNCITVPLFCLPVLRRHYYENLQSESRPFPLPSQHVQTLRHSLRYPDNLATEPHTTCTHVIHSLEGSCDKILPRAGTKASGRRQRQKRAGSPVDAALKAQENEQDTTFYNIINVFKFLAR
jgi:hypothetical protein